MMPCTGLLTSSCLGHSLLERRSTPFATRRDTRMPASSPSHTMIRSCCAMFLTIGLECFMEYYLPRLLVSNTSINVSLLHVYAFSQRSSALSSLLQTATRLTTIVTTMAPWMLSVLPTSQEITFSTGSVTSQDSCCTPLIFLPFISLPRNETGRLSTRSFGAVSGSLHGCF